MMNRSVLRQGNLFSLKHTAQSIDIYFVAGRRLGVMLITQLLQELYRSQLKRQ